MTTLKPTGKIFDKWMQPKSDTTSPYADQKARVPNNQYSGKPRKVAYDASTFQKQPLLKPSNAANQEALVQHVVKRMQLGLIERDARWSRCSQIDIQLQGFIKHDKDDKKRYRDILTKGQVKPTDHNLAMADAQLDDATAYLMSVYAPDMNLFESAAPADKAEEAKALTQTINDQGQYGQYYRHLSKFCDDALRYNFSGITCYWEQVNGVVFKGGETGTVSKTNGIVWEGNAIKTVDVYNFFYDTTVLPADLPKKGEWFAEVELITPFRAKKQEADGLEFGIDRFYNDADGSLVQPKWLFYKAPPMVRRDQLGLEGSSATNWQETLRAQAGPAQSSAPGIERIKFTGWIKPYLFGLSPSKNYELWRVHIMQGCYVTLAVKLEDTHGMLPCTLAQPLENDLRTDQRTYAERLIPLQHFQSFLVNSHQAGVRKSLYGVTVYNQNLFPGMDLSKEDMTSATIPMRGSALGVDIDKAFRHYDTAPTTGQNVDMIEKVDAIMQKILPTDVYRQVADLNRATLYQAAATVQTGNRRSLKIARILSSQSLEVLKTMMVYNIYANQEAIDYIDEQGNSQTLSPAQFVDLGLEKYISNGLRGIDRLMIISAYQDVLTAILQSQQAIAEFDIVKMIAYFFNLVGQPVDLNQFRKPMAQQVAQSTLQNGAPPQLTPPDSNAPPSPAPQP